MLSYTDIWNIVNRWGIEMRVTRLHNLALLSYGILKSCSGCLSTIVRPDARQSLNGRIAQAGKQWH